MNLRLVKASEEYRSQIIDMMEEWNDFGEKIVPYAIRRLVLCQDLVQNKMRGFAS